jgi:dihydrofolate reductase
VNAGVLAPTNSAAVKVRISDEVRGDLASEIAAIKAEPGPDVIAWGGATVAAALAAGGLIDEYRLAAQPVATGSGQRCSGSGLRPYGNGKTPAWEVRDRRRGLDQAGAAGTEPTSD